MLMVEFFGFSMSAIVPEGPSDGMSAESSTIVMSPPPLPAIGSAFIAGFGRTIVCKLPLPEDTTVCFSGVWRIEETKSPNTPARAEAGIREPRTSSNDMRVAAGRTVLDELYFIARGCFKPDSESLFFLSCISRFQRFVSFRSLLTANQFHRLFISCYTEKEVTFCLSPI